MAAPRSGYGMGRNRTPSPLLGDEAVNVSMPSVADGTDTTAVLRFHRLPSLRLAQMLCSTAGTGMSAPGAGSAAGSKMVAPRPIRPSKARTIMAIP
jgi:hypothetical protein